MFNRLAGNIVVLVLFLTVLSGCGTEKVKAYSGKQLARNEVATISSVQADLWVGTVEGKGYCIIIKSVDGKTCTPAFLPDYTPLSIEVRPGKHDIGYRIEYLGTTEKGVIAVEAEAGHDYKLRAYKSKGDDDYEVMVIDNGPH